MSREKGRKQALRTLMERRKRADNPRSLNEKYYRTTVEVLAFKYREQLQEHMDELRRLGLDPNLIGEHEADPIMCSHCGEPIPWKVILGYRS